MKGRTMGLAAAGVLVFAGLLMAQDGGGRKGGAGGGMGGGQKLGKEEKAQRQELAETVRERFADMDADKDGKITYEEFKAYWDKHLRERFDRLDRNGDGVVSKDDLKARRGENQEVAPAKGGVTQPEMPAI